MSTKRLAIILSHPVQYYSPLFRCLSEEVDLKVFYAFQPDAEQQGKDGFGKAFQWDIDLLKGYEYEFLQNIADQPTSAHYKGCDTPSIGDKLKEYGVTHVVTFGWHLKMYRQALNHCKKHKIPIAVRGDSQLNPDLPFWKKLIKKIVYPFFLNQYDAFLSVGQRNREYLRYYGITDEKIIFSPHAVDQQYWNLGRLDQDKDLNTFTFIWVAKFIPKKRPLDVIDAFKLLVKDETKIEIELQMVGNGVLLEKSKKSAAGFKQIKFPGFKNQSELREIYAVADCLILSSNYEETWGLVVNEAFAAGLPAIVSDACGCSPDMIHKFTGLRYGLANTYELKAAMSSMIRTIGKRSNQVSYAINNVNKQYSYSSVNHSFKQFIDNER